MDAEIIASQKACGCFAHIWAFSRISVCYRTPLPLMIFTCCSCLTKGYWKANAIRAEVYFLLR